MLSLPSRPSRSSVSIINNISYNIQLHTNMFPLSVNDIQSSNSENSQAYDGNLVCYQYSVAFEPSIAEDNQSLMKKIIKQAQRSIEAIVGRYVFSGKSLFSFKNINVNKIQKIMNIEGNHVDGQTYSIQLKFNQNYQLNYESAQQKDDFCPNFKNGNKVIQVLNIMLKNILENEGFKQFGRNSNFFDKQSKKQVQIQNNPRQVIEVYNGFTSKVTLGKKLYMAIEYSSRIFRVETALQYLLSIAGQSVITKYNNYRAYIIDRVDFSKNPSSTFLYNKTNQQISYAQYYLQRYGVKISNMQQPLLLHKRKYREANTNIEKYEEIFLIPELCTITGLTVQQRLNKQAMKELANHTKLTPQQRYQNSIQNSLFLSDKIQNSGIKINLYDNKIDAIQLKLPKINLGGKSFITLKHGGNFEELSPFLNKQVFKNIEWALIYHNQDEQNVYKLVDLLQTVSHGFGDKFKEPQYLKTYNWNPRSWIELLDEEGFSKNNPPEFVITFCRAYKQYLYTEMKKFFCSKDGPGIISQNVTPKALQKKCKSVASKIVLQIASKLGYRIWSVEKPDGINKNTMLIGIETSMKKIKNQQIIGVVASINKDFTEYYSEVDIRNDNDTTLPTLSKAIHNAILAYIKKTNFAPEEIIIYRQGLGEGQIQQSYQLEIKAIQNGFSHHDKNYSPRFAFFQVNKKISQKFYQQTHGIISNPHSGTIVATEIVQNNFEFFMAAQNCNSGVCTPTKYTCLFNNTNLKEDQFWQITYYQTFNYYNWKGPIRVPAVMKYAEKLAKFTSDTLQEIANDNLINSLYYI
ncbi:hypothetical protein ABPG74_015850 [Tetrahymena malaccensis]